MDAYQQLMAHIRPVYVFSTISRLLQWDAETMMPAGAVSYRAAQLAELERIKHEQFTSPRVGELLEASASEALDPHAQANVRELRRDYERARKLPADFVVELARLRTVAKRAWAQARRENDFDQFAPYLKQLVDRVREKAEYLGYAQDPYDALLDEYEPGATAANTEALLEPLGEALRELVQSVEHSPARVSRSLLRAPVPVERQRRLAVAAAEEIGFRFDAGRLDTSEHPFCAGLNPRDVRITVRFREDDPLTSFFAILHEAGHGLYAQGLPEEHQYSPCGEPAFLGVHESQARFWENCIGRSQPFWERFFPRLQREFGDPFFHMSLDTFFRALNAVTADYIRVHADELTYNLHILLRFELERALINRSLDVAELPAAWNDRLKHYLDLDPPDPAHGVLQDIHWSMGVFGYFPTYTLGNLYAAQLRAAIWNAVPDVEDRIRAGEFASILEWLRENVHRWGRMVQPAELIERATGQPPSAQFFIDYVREKYLTLFG